MKVKPDDLASFKPSQTPSVYLIKSKSYGSGKITRRVEIDSVLHSVRKRGRLRKKKRRDGDYASSIIPRKQAFLSDNKLDFKTSAIRRQFKYWNSLGHPFVKHIAKKSKATTEIISKLKPISKKYEMRQVIDAFDVGHRLFSDKQFIYHFPFNKRKIELHTFLQTSAEQHRVFNGWDTVKRFRKRFGVSMPDSWFSECLKGWRYVEKKYCLIVGVEDKHPEVTKQAVKMMEIHRPGRPINDKGLEDITKFVNILFNYAELNEMDPYWLFDRIESALNSFHTIKIDKTHYLTTNIFWSDTLPSELIRFDKRGFEYRTLVCDREKLLK